MKCLCIYVDIFVLIDPWWCHNVVVVVCGSGSSRARISSKNLLVRRTSGFAKPLVRNEIHLSDPRKS